MGGQDEATEAEEEDVAPWRNAESTSAQGHDRGQGQAGEQDPAEDDQNGGEDEPFSEKPRKAKEKNGQVDLGETAGARRHGVIIFLFLDIWPICAKINFTF